MDGRQSVRQLCGENLRDVCNQETSRGGGGSVMVWAAIRYGFVTRRVPGPPGQPLPPTGQKGLREGL